MSELVLKLWGWAFRGYSHCLYSIPDNHGFAHNFIFDFSDHLLHYPLQRLKKTVSVGFPLQSSSSPVLSSLHTLLLWDTPSLRRPLPLAISFILHSVPHFTSDCRGSLLNFTLHCEEEQGLVSFPQVHQLLFSLRLYKIIHDSRMHGKLKACT